MFNINMWMCHRFCFPTFVTIFMQICNKILCTNFVTPFLMGICHAFTIVIQNIPFSFERL